MAQQATRDEFWSSHGRDSSYITGMEKREIAYAGEILHVFGVSKESGRYGAQWVVHCERDELPGVERKVTFSATEKRDAFFEDLDAYLADARSLDAVLQMFTTQNNQTAFALREPVTGNEAE